MKSNPRGDTQIVSGLSVSLSTLSGGIFLLSGVSTPAQPSTPPSSPGGCVCREHYSLSRRLLASPIHPRPSPSLADYIRGQILRRSGGISLLHHPSSPSLATDRTLYSARRRVARCAWAKRRGPDRRRESFPRIYGLATVPFALGGGREEEIFDRESESGYPPTLWLNFFPLVEIYCS